MIVDAHAHIFSEIRGLGAAGMQAMMPTYDETGRLLSIRRHDIHSTDTDRKQRYSNSQNSTGDKVQSPPSPREKIRHTPDMLIASMDLAGVDKTVLLQGPVYGEYNRYVSDAVHRYPDRFIGAAYLDPWDPNCRSEFETIITSSVFRAIKLEFSDTAGLCSIHPDARLDMPNVAWLWGELAQHQLVLVFDLGTVGSYSYQTDGLRRIAEEYPTLKIVICHLAQPTLAVEADLILWSMWEKQIALGNLPNIWFDTASLPAYVQHEGYPYPGAGRYLRMAVNRIGPLKLMWGTDMPMVLAYATYPQLVEMARLHTQFLSPSERSMVLGKNALQVYGI